MKNTILVSRALRYWLRRLVFSKPKRLWFGTAIALVTALFGMALLGLSGWFISATALAGGAIALGLVVSFDVFLPGGGIRFFALGRTVSRYVERLYNHDTVLRQLALARHQLFTELTHRSIKDLRSTSNSEWLSRLTVDLDTLDSLSLRLVYPPLVAFISLLVLAGVDRVGEFVEGGGPGLGGHPGSDGLVQEVGEAVVRGVGQGVVEGEEGGDAVAALEGVGRDEGQDGGSPGGGCQGREGTPEPPRGVVGPQQAGVPDADEGESPQELGGLGRCEGDGPVASCLVGGGQLLVGRSRSAGLGLGRDRHRCLRRRGGVGGDSGGGGVGGGGVVRCGLRGPVVPPALWWVPRGVTRPVAG